MKKLLIMCIIMCACAFGCASNNVKNEARMIKRYEICAHNYNKYIAYCVVHDDNPKCYEKAKNDYEECIY